MLPYFKQKSFKLGELGEKCAVAYLKKLGYKIICTNFTNKFGRRLGEIDIIAKDQTEFVFIEVKTRKNNSEQIITPEENITSQKLYKLKKITDHYIKTNNLWDKPYRFDAVSIFYSEITKKFKIKHLKNIFL